MTYTVEISPAAKSQIKKLTKAVQKLIIRQLEQLESNPYPAGVKKMSQSESFYRVRVGDYRIIYQVQNQALVVLVVKAAHRREVYRR